MALSDIVRVDISIQRAALTAAGFGVPLILGDNAPFAETYRLYSSLTGMVDDGFATNDEEYLMAQTLLSQAKRPRNFLVGRQATQVAQVWTVTIATVTNSVAYTLTITRPGRAPIVVTITSGGSATNTAIRDALVTALDSALTGIADATAGDATHLTITATDPGASFTVTATTANLTVATTTPNHGPAEDLDAIIDEGGAWYCTLLTSRDVDDIIEVGRWTESAAPSKIFLGQTSEATAPQSTYDSGSPDDVAEILRALGYTRTSLWWHDDDTEYVDAGIAGLMLPEEPGSESWAIKQLVGVTATLGVGSSAALPIPESQRSNLIGPGPGPGQKHANIYYALTSEIGITARATMASGNWIDEIRFVDWLEATMAARIGNVMLTNLKIPFTDQGINMIAAQVHSSLQDGERVGGIAKDPKYVVTVPGALDVSAENRAARVLDPPITFSARLAGAVHEITVEGSVSA